MSGDPIATVEDLAITEHLLVFALQAMSNRHRTIEAAIGLLAALENVE